MVRVFSRLRVSGRVLPPRLTIFLMSTLMTLNRLPQMRVRFLKSLTTNPRPSLTTSPRPSLTTSPRPSFSSPTIMKLIVGDEKLGLGLVVRLGLGLVVRLGLGFVVRLFKNLTLI